MTKFIEPSSYYNTSTIIMEELKDCSSFRDTSFIKLLNNYSAAIILTNAQGNILHANNTACKLLGYSLNELKKFNWGNLLSSAYPKFQEKFKHLQVGNEYKATILKDNEGNVINVMVFQDPVEVKFQYSELNLLTNNTEEGFLLLDKGLKIISFNLESVRLFQTLVHIPLVKGASIYDYAKPERIVFLTQLYERVLNGGSESAKVSFTSETGKLSTFKIKYNPALDDDDEIVGVFICFKNVTKEEEHLEALQQTQETLRKIMDSSLDIICSLNRAGIYIQISAVAEKIWGYKVEEIIGRHYSDFVTREYKEPNAETKKKIREGFDLQNFENCIIGKDGNIINMEWSANYNEQDQLMYCVGRDVTEKKHAKDKLLQSEQRFKSLIQDGADLLGVMDRNGNLSYISPASYSLLQYYPEELENKKFFDYIHPEDIKTVNRDFKKLSRQQKLQLKPFRYQNKVGEWCWLETTITNLLDEDSVKGYVFNARDITERIKTEANIKFTAKLLDTIGQAAIATNLDGVVTYWNAAAETIYGYSSEEAIGKNIMDITLAPDSIETSSTIMRKLAKGESWTGEFVVKRKDQTIFPAMITNTPILDQQGKVSGIIGISSDITERKLAERELEIANERNNLILKATNDVVWDWNFETQKVIRSAENMKILFGYNQNDDINNPNFWRSNVHPEEQEIVKAKFANFINDPSQYYMDCEYRFKNSDGSFSYVYDKAFIIRNKEGKAMRMIGSVKDMSYVKREEIKLKLINEELVQQAKELAFSNSELEQFAYVASHDLQEPLRMVSSFLTQIEKKYEPVLDEKGKRYIHFAVDGAKRMRQIILDLLEYSRAGNKELERESVNLEIILKEVKALLRRKIEDKNATISSDPLPVINAHTSPMRQVFQNLISNALIYNRDGVAPNIQIKVMDVEKYWRFEVKDNGIGIPSEYFEKIFVIFQRLHGKDTYEGSGVGLSITKKIIDHLGGCMWLESTVGEGTSFYFTIYK